MRTKLFAAAILCFAINVVAQPARYADQSASSNDTLGGDANAAGRQQQTAAGSKKPHPGTSDIVAATFSSVPLVQSASQKPPAGSVAVNFDAFETSVKEVKGGQSIIWSSGNSLFNAISDAVKAQTPIAQSDFSCAGTPLSGQAYIFHIKWWTNNTASPIAGGRLVSSDWYVYHQSKSKSGQILVRDSLGGLGDPVIYGAKNALVVGIDIFDTYIDGSDGKTKIRYGGKLSTKYQVTVTQGSPANWTNLGSLASGLLGLKAVQTGAGGDSNMGYIAVACQKGTKSLPFDLAINETVVDDSPPNQAKAPAAPSAGILTCNGANQSPPCTMSRTFTSTDREYWDISMGVAIPGVRESGFTFSTTTNTVSAKKTTHTEAYAFLDVYPLAAKASKDSAVPHINLGIPVTTKSLYRPYFGLADNLTGWNGLQQKMKIPTGISVFAGMCWIKTQQLPGTSPTTQSAFNSDLTYHRVWKPMFGVEVSVSALASKLGGKSKNANGSSSTGQASGSQ